MLRPIRTTLTLTAVLALLVIGAMPVTAGHHPSHDEQACHGTSVDEQAEVCGQVSVTLTAGTETTIEEIISRSAPDATVEEGNKGGEDGHYLLLVPVGTEVDSRDSLQADPDVEQASFVQLGWLTAEGDEDGTDALPDTATPPAATHLTSVLGALMLGSAVVAHVAMRGRRR